MQAAAAFYTGNRSFSLEQVPVVGPGPGEVRIDVAFCGICGTDLHIYLGHMDARTGHHRIIGHEMSGVIAEIGEGVTGFSVGERVVVRPLDHCGDCPACDAGHTHICHNLKFIGIDRDGAFQQTWNVPAHTLHRIPDALTLRDAALIEPLAVACHDVARGRVAETDDVLVIGGGPIGLLVAMVAQRAAKSVTLSEINPNRVAFARKIGFDVLVPDDGDPVEEANRRTGGKGYDVVFEVSGSQAGADLMTAVAATRGRIVMVAIHADMRQVDLFRFFWREIEMLGARVYAAADFDEAIGLLAGGEVRAADIITGTATLAEIGSAFAELAGNPQSIKTLIRCADGEPV